jgi:hypothetical protein
LVASGYRRRDYDVHSYRLVKRHDTEVSIVAYRGSELLLGEEPLPVGWSQTPDVVSIRRFDASILCGRIERWLNHDFPALVVTMGCSTKEGERLGLRR